MKNQKRLHKTILAATFSLGLALGLASCNLQELTPMENVVANQKTRPFAVVCDPPEAAPGDTVSVRLYYYAPPADSPSIHWDIALDYGMEINGNVFEKNIQSLDAMMLAGGKPDSFRFVVPPSVLVNSSQIDLLMNNPKYNPVGMTVTAIDTMLKLAIQNKTPLSPLEQMAADNFSTQLKLRAHLVSSISLDVTMLLRVRYSSDLDTANVNHNPVINWMGVIRVRESDFHGTDSFPFYPYQFQYLYNRAHPDSVRDTIVVDSGYRLLAVADSGINGTDTQIQVYDYYPSPGSVLTDTESFRYSWFYSNLDYNPNMIMDSLILFEGGRDGSMRTFLPPVDTAMHHFQLYLVVRDRRRQDIGASPGEAYQTAMGVFIYTPAYARNMVRKSGGLFGN